MPKMLFAEEDDFVELDYDGGGDERESDAFCNIADIIGVPFASSDTVSVPSEPEDDCKDFKEFGSSPEVEVDSWLSPKPVRVQHYGEVKEHDKHNFHDDGTNFVATKKELAPPSRAPEGIKALIRYGKFITSNKRQAPSSTSTTSAAKEGPYVYRTGKPGHSLRSFGNTLDVKSTYESGHSRKEVSSRKDLGKSTLPIDFHASLMEKQMDFFQVEKPKKKPVSGGKNKYPRGYAQLADRETIVYGNGKTIVLQKVTIFVKRLTVTEIQRWKKQSGNSMKHEQVVSVPKLNPKKPAGQNQNVNKEKPKSKKEHSKAPETKEQFENTASVKKENEPRTKLSTMSSHKLQIIQENRKRKNQNESGVIPAKIVAVPIEVEKKPIEQVPCEKTVVDNSIFLCRPPTETEKFILPARGSELNRVKIPKAWPKPKPKAIVSNKSHLERTVDLGYRRRPHIDYDAVQAEMEPTSGSPPPAEKRAINDYGDLDTLFSFSPAKEVVYALPIVDGETNTLTFHRVDDGEEDVILTAHVAEEEIQIQVTPEKAALGSEIIRTDKLLLKNKEEEVVHAGRTRKGRSRATYSDSSNSDSDTDSEAGGGRSRTVLPTQTLTATVPDPTTTDWKRKLFESLCPVEAGKSDACGEVVDDYELNLDPFDGDDIDDWLMK